MSKVKIDFVKPVLGLDGNPAIGYDGTVEHLNKIAANLMGQCQKGDAFKYVGWAIDTYAGKAIELEPKDAEELKQYFERLAIGALIKVRLLECFK